jgi:hypothetical protein
MKLLDSCSVLSWYSDIFLKKEEELLKRFCCHVQISIHTLALCFPGILIFFKKKEEELLKRFCCHVQISIHTL